MNRIDTLFQKAIEDRVFPSASVCVFNKEGILFSKTYGYLTYESTQQVTDKHLYDIASLTKPLATSIAIASIVQLGEIKFDMYLSHFFSQFNSPERLNITIRDLLNHRSGLPSYREYFRNISEDQWGNLSAKDYIINAALNEEITGYSKTVYSDIGYIILGHLLEKITTMNLRDYLVNYIYKPLQLTLTDFCGSSQFIRKDVMVPVTDLFIGVDDENCRAMGGIAGHAGPFSNSYEIYLILKEIYNSYIDADWRLFKPHIIKELLRRSNDFKPSMFRGGFDTPLEKGSQYGDYLSNEAICHLGFTGTSFAMDLKNGGGIILLTNRVCPDRNNTKIKEFRPMIHNEIFTIFKGELGL